MPLDQREMPTVAVDKGEARLVNAVHDGVALHEAVADFRLACVSRAIDDREITLRTQNRAFFQISGAGHEALLLGFARELRPGYDWFFPYYRDRALVLGLGVSPDEMLLQTVGSADDPASGGRQMPCHWGDRDRHIVTQSSATGTQCLPAVGCAEAARYIVRRNLPGCHAYGDEVTYVSLGEGATSEGEFWESLNTACRLALPVVYVVADNGYAISVRSTDQAPAPISELVAGFRGLAVTAVDGCDYFAVRASARDTIARARAGQGPALVHATVTRPYSHSLSDDQTKYRTSEDLAVEQTHDPITALEDELVRLDALTREQAEAIRSEAQAEVAEAANRALAARRPDPASFRQHLSAPLPVVELREDPAVDESAEVVTLGEAIRRTLHEVMGSDERIRVFGEDVADGEERTLAEVPGKGGVFGITFGLQREYGQARCFNTPLAEANIVGRACGQGIRGLRPSPEIQFFDYIWPAMQQIKTELATIRWRSNGAFSCPTVLRVPIGGYLTGGAIWHSQCGESIFAHIPGLHIVMPSRARDAAGLLRTAFRCDDPVLFLEHKHLYRQGYARDPFPPAGWLLPFGRGAVVQAGSSATVVTWGATVHRAELAAQAIDASGVSIEIIDLRTIAPWDRDLVAESIAKTGKVLVLHEDTLTCGFGAEVAAWIADECFDDLDAPVMRLAARDTPVAYEPTLEDAILPQVSDIERHLAHLLSY
jgi:2-oxoisovalerate dehydrogenase E1 component